MQPPGTSLCFAKSLTGSVGIPLNDVTVILRESGERTAKLAYALLTQIFAESQIFRVSEVPFSAALRRSFRIGIEQQRTWTLCIDADVLVLKSGVEELVNVARLQPDHVFELQGMVFDKLFGYFRPAGNHLYRSRMLNEALSLIPSEGSSLRPEYDTLLAMHSKGFRHIQLFTSMGLHDFEQDYEAIFHKCFLQSKKHANHAAYLQQHWKMRQDDDDDFLVAMHAFELGTQHTGQVLVDRRFNASTASQVVDKLSLKAKSPSPDEHWAPIRVQATVSSERESMNEPTLLQQAALIHEVFVRPVLIQDKDSRATSIIRRGLDWIQFAMRRVDK
jgi:hypothetical protein